MEIPLSNGGVALIDDEDFPLVSSFTWHWRRKKPTSKVKYAICIRGGKQIRMHRVVLKLTDPSVKTDHKNRDGLDNRKHNLRIATNSQNMANVGPYRNNTSGFRGVSLDKRSRKWVAYLCCNNKPRNLGSFPSPTLAALARDRAALAAFGEFAYLNFPQTASL